MAKGGQIGNYRVVPMKRIQVAGSPDLLDPYYSVAFTINGSLSEANEKAQNFVKNNDEIISATVTKIHPSGHPLKHKKVSYITKDEILKYEDGGYMAKGGKLSQAEFEKKYEENEDNNFHSENVVLLAEQVGTDSDIRDAKRILALHEAMGSLPSFLGQERRDLHEKLWKKYEKSKGGSKEKGGYMAKGGETHRYEKGGYMAKGGATEHGLMAGDHIMVVNGNILGIRNEETGDFATLDISTGERNDAPHLKESLGLMRYYSRNKE